MGKFGIAEIRKAFRCDFEKGLIFSNMKRKGAPSLRPLGWRKYPSKRHSLIVILHGEVIAVEEIVWQLANGEIPRDGKIIHRDGNTDNNKLVNLMLCQNDVNGRTSPVRMSMAGRVIRRLRERLYG